MGKIFLNTDAVYNLKSDINSKRNTCSDCSSKVYSIQNNLYWKVLNRSRIRTRLNNLRTRINRQSELLYSYARILETVNDNMTDTDNRMKNEAKKLTCDLNRITKIMSVCQKGSKRSKKIWGLDVESYSFIMSLFGMKLIGPVLSSKAHLLHSIYKGITSGNIENLKDFSQDKMVVYLRDNSSYDTGFWKFNYFATFLGERNDFLDSLKISWAKGTDIITGFFTGESYEEQIMKKSLSGILQNVSNNDIETTEIPDEVKNIVKILKEGGNIKELHLSETSKKSNIYKHLIENEEFYKGMGKVSKAIKHGELTTEYVEYLLTDYTKNAEYLETLKAGLNSTETDNAVLLKVVDGLQVEYSNKWVGTFVKASEKTIEELGGKTIGAAADLASGGLYSLVDLGKDIANEITGLNDEVDSLESLYGMHQYSNDLISSYDYYADKIRSGDFTEDDLTRCKSLFELTKSAKIEEYQAMIDLTKDSSQKKVLEKEMQKLNNMSYTTSYAGSGGGRF